MTTSTVPVTLGKKQFVGNFAALMGTAFANDTLVRLFMAEEEGQTSTADITASEVHVHFIPLVEDSVNLGGEIIEAGPWVAAALWRPPETNTVIKPFPDAAKLPSLVEFLTKREEMRRKYLHGRPFWYLHMIGRDHNVTLKGAVRAVMVPYLERARADGVPAWLEATNPHARDVYAHFGFRTVESITVGEGSPFPTATIYGMIYEP